MTWYGALGEPGDGNETERWAFVASVAMFVFVAGYQLGKVLAGASADPFILVAVLGSTLVTALALFGDETE